VVDVLDECQQGPLLASTLITASRMSKRVVKILLTSREEPELLDSLSQGLNELVIAPDVVSDPILLYVEKRVSRCKEISGTELGAWVRSRVAGAASGSWLYARLIMDEIQRLPSAASIKQQLQTIQMGSYNYMTKSSRQWNDHSLRYS
jgi:hypothetical protein